MKIYIAKSINLDNIIFINLSKLLLLYSMPLEFIFCQESFDEDNPVWYREKLYENMISYRFKHKIPSESFLIFLTAKRDSKNWFSACLPSWEKNIFVSTIEWTQDNLITVNKKEYPIAYQIIENIFQHLIANDNVEYLNISHSETIGCINDMCENKKDIIFKLRTADICNACYQKAIGNGLDSEIFEQIIEILENIRFQFLHNSRAFDIFQKSILNSKLKVLEELNYFLSTNLGNNESVIQKWIDEDNGIHRKQRAMIFGLDFFDIKREGEIHMRKRFDILAEQNNNSHIILELKSPNAEIFNIERRFNKNGGHTTDYSLSADLARAIPQILSYKHWYDTMSPEQIESLGIDRKRYVSECIIVIGQRKDDNTWKRNFEDLNKNISIKILTYNDLIDKMANTISNIKFLLK